MEVILKSRNGKITERQRSYLENKLEKLTRYMDQISSAKVEIAHQQRLHEGEVYRLQVTLIGEHGVILRAEQQASELQSAADLVHDVLQRKIKKYKDKHWRRGKLRRKGNEFVQAESAMHQEPDASSDEEHERRIVRVKQFTFKPMFSDEAIEQMELLGHSFFVFRDADTSHVSVVYRRNDGHYGLIVPEQ